MDPRGSPFGLNACFAEGTFADVVPKARFGALSAAMANPPGSDAATAATTPSRRHFRLNVFIDATPFKNEKYACFWRGRFLVFGFDAQRQLRTLERIRTIAPPETSAFHKPLTLFMEKRAKPRMTYICTPIYIDKRRSARAFLTTRFIMAARRRGLQSAFGLNNYERLKNQLLEGAARVFGQDRAGSTETPVDLKALHAKIADHCKTRRADNAHTNVATKPYRLFTGESAR